MLGESQSMSPVCLHDNVAYIADSPVHPCMRAVPERETKRSEHTEELLRVSLFHPIQKKLNVQ